ncbi:MAG TPA: glycosyltransferase family 39 protein [Bryobacteraceae bacterium]|nr:glycosyltransferase family 39 protein [Bryobacteraceae bacterium]
MKAGRARRAAAAVVFLLLAAVTVYGFFHEHLLAELLWTPQGWTRLLLYTLIYWAAAGGLLLFAPRWLGAGAAGFAFLYSMWWCGPVAPLAALYFLGACFFLGRMISRQADIPASILLGMTAWMFAIWVALHFPVNTRAVYGLAMAIPYIWEARRWRKHLFGVRLFPKSRTEAAGLALLLFVLMAHWLLALKPEIGDDALSMHLALPMMVAHNGRWAFDFHQYTWSLMPAGGDCIFSAAYLLGGTHGGEAAARLVNFALLALMAAMIVQISKRWLSPSQAFLAAALFASTPLAGLVTGSLFVENVWAALILGGSLAVFRYCESKESGELRNAGILFGGAMAVKAIAAVLIAPASIFAIWAAMRSSEENRSLAVAVRKRTALSLIPAAALFAVIAAPSYVYALVKTGNPVFPFENTIFKSAYFDAAAPFVDGRFVQPLSWRTPYDATFRSAKFIEAQGGAAGFQYFLLLIPAALLLRKRSAQIFLIAGAVGAVALFAIVPNLRYAYPALPLFSIALGLLLAEYPRTGVGIFILAIAANFWFFPAAGWYHRDFALFRQNEAKQYLTAGAPQRELIARLNRTAPAEPAAFFGTDEIAGLNAPAYVNNWHTYDFSNRVRAARDTSAIAGILRGLGIRHIIAPVSFHTERPVLDNFLQEWAEPEGAPAGSFGLFKLRSVPVPLQIAPFPPGSYDDLDDRIEYTGDWLHDMQFAQAASGSVTYSAGSGDSLRFSFTGSGIEYIFTKALNRGIALVQIDGAERARIDMYSRETQWQSSRKFDGLSAGKHTFEVRVLGSKNPQSSGTFVDLDAFVVIR